MIKLSAEIVANPHALGYLCRVEVREYGKSKKPVLSTSAVAKGTAREAWHECAKFVSEFTGKRAPAFSGTRRRRR